MPFLIEHITEVVLSLLILVVLGTGTLVTLALGRRRRRTQYFQRLDELRQNFGPVVAAILNGKVEYARGLDALKSITGFDRLYFLEQLLFDKPVTPNQLPTLRKLCIDLGLVAVWQRQLTGQFDTRSLREAMGRPEGMLQRVTRLHFLLRAKSAEYLGLIRHRESWRLLVKALDDPHADVQMVAARSLAAIGEPESFAPLVARLQRILQTPGEALSLRSVKSALVSFPLRESIRLIPSLSHTHPRVRFLAVDIIREMVEREAAADEDFTLDTAAFGANLTEMFLTQCCFDDNPDVRARSAPVIAYLSDPRATPVLLTLLGDPQWFVRLHTVRALAKRKFLPQTEQIADRLTDSQWAVREAAARTLLVFGRVGVDRLADHLLNSRDRYSQEQIADEMQRAGLIPTLLAQYAGESGRNGREFSVFKQMAEMGKTSYLLSILSTNPDRSLRKRFLMDFGRHPNAQIRAWVRQMALKDNDAELRDLAASMVGNAASVAAEGAR